MTLSILTFTGYYLPGYKGGGPLRTLANMVDKLGEEFTFKIITNDRDLGSSCPYPEIKINEWQDVGNARVYYLTPEKQNLKDLSQLIRSTEHDILYLNSFFSPGFTIKPLLLRRLGCISKVPTVVASRGEFSEGALAIKKEKKRMYIAAAKALGLYSDVLWQASSSYEKQDIRRWFGPNVSVAMAPDLPPAIAPLSEKGNAHSYTKKPGTLKVVFLSRISPIKNLKGALEYLKDIKGDISFNIYGPIEDKGYWEECKKNIKLLPPNVKVEYKGTIDYSKVKDVYREHDLFLLPTKGENFGHVILEALSVGCPVLISDRTPWRELMEKRVGFDLSLEKPDLFREALERMLAMGEEEHKKWRFRGKEFALDFSNNKDLTDKSRRLFADLISANT